MLTRTEEFLDLFVHLLVEQARENLGGASRAYPEVQRNAVAEAMYLDAERVARFLEDL